MIALKHNLKLTSRPETPELNKAFERLQAKDRAFEQATLAAPIHEAMIELSHRQKRVDVLSEKLESALADLEQTQHRCRLIMKGIRFKQDRKEELTEPEIRFMQATIRLRKARRAPVIQTKSRGVSACVGWVKCVQCLLRRRAARRWRGPAEPRRPRNGPNVRSTQWTE